MAFPGISRTMKNDSVTTIKIVTSAMIKRLATYVTIGAP